ncbi:hypothetical protein Taro_055178, partial [Colocasia esculenta]|nr:hypothetical protein [Colocasia esculenta]
VDLFAESSVPEMVDAIIGKITLAASVWIWCSKASRHKMCIRACNTCCQRCHCVPPGTSGNEDVCPCYANMKTHGGRHKCP